jgi:hypothetical protein
MGWSLCWLAIKGKTPQAVREVLGFRPTREFVGVGEAPIAAAEMPNGWYVIACDHEERVAYDPILQDLSVGCELVTCFLEEHVMYCSATGWRDGKQCWGVIHDSQKDRQHLEVSGEPPATFAEIRQKWFAKDTRGDCDYIFEIPLETARSVTGFCHDQDIPGLRYDAFEVLEGKVPVGEPPAKRSWLQKFLGW